MNEEFKEVDQGGAATADEPRESVLQALRSECSELQKFELEGIEITEKGLVVPEGVTPEVMQGFLTKIGKGSHAAELPSRFNTALTLVRADAINAALKRFPESEASQYVEAGGWSPAYTEQMSIFGEQLRCRDYIDVLPLRILRDACHSQLTGEDQERIFSHIVEKGRAIGRKYLPRAAALLIIQEAKQAVGIKPKPRARATWPPAVPFKLVLKVNAGELPEEFIKRLKPVYNETVRLFTDPEYANQLIKDAEAERKATAKERDDAAKARAKIAKERETKGRRIISGEISRLIKQELGDSVEATLRRGEYLDIEDYFRYPLKEWSKVISEALPAKRLSEAKKALKAIRPEKAETPAGTKKAASKRGKKTDAVSTKKAGGKKKDEGTAETAPSNVVDLRKPRDKKTGMSKRAAKAKSAAAGAGGNDEVPI
jgi:hypothetical protein